MTPAELALDPVALTSALVRRPSVTPDEAGALTLLAEALSAHGFELRRVDEGGVSNLIARFGGEGPVFGFAGHTDVVPPGDAAAWTRAPFSGEVADGALWGRGAADMKSGVAAFVAASCGLVADGRLSAEGPGAVMLLITGDEEGPAEHGTKAILAALARDGARLDACLVGEPTSRETFGDAMKIGRRGSLHARLTARGAAGHVAYPASARRNPLPRLVRLIDRLASAEIDAGNAHFEPSSLQVTTVDTGNPVGNMTPAAALAALNIRYNDTQTPAALTAWIESEALKAAPPESGVAIEVETRSSGDAFVTEPGPLTDLVGDAVERVAGRRPRLETNGGTSDARFIQAVCPVVEFGLVGATMHQVDEHVATDEIPRLARVYRGVLERYLDL